MDHALVVEGLRKTYDQGGHRVEALRDVNFEVPQGQFVAIMGASGSGKSTLLHVMAGLTQVDAGQVLIGGQSIHELNDKQMTIFRRSRLGLVFQSFNLMPELSAEENISLPLVLGGQYNADAKARVATLLEELNIAARREHRPLAMSGGEQQRVAIGRALAIEPDLILADEPTGNLDSENAHHVCKLLVDMNKKYSRSIVMVTHEVHVAAYADRVLIMRDGQLIKDFEVTKHDERWLSEQYQTAVSQG